MEPAIRSLEPAELYALYAPMVMRRVRQFHSPTEAEDVMHDVFIRAFEHIGSFRGDASIVTWLNRIATHTCLNRLRSRKRQAKYIAEYSIGLEARLSQKPSAEHLLFLRQLWRELDEDLAVLGIYYYVDGLTHNAIARILGVSPRTVGNRLNDLRAFARRRAGLEVVQ